MKQMNASELAAWLPENPAMLVDVREAHELTNGMLKDAKHIPMNHVPARIDELESAKNSPIVLICRSGQRSMQVGQFLEQSGFTDVINLQGGMNSWATDVDPSMRVY